MAGIGPLYEEQWKPIKELSKQEMAEEIERWRTLWGWVSEDVKYYLTKIGMMCRVIRGNYSGTFGELLQPKFRLSELEVGVREKTYDHNDGKYYMETKIVKLDANRLIDIEFISERKLYVEAEDIDLVQLLEPVEGGIPNGSDEIQR